ncbi:hypothetical protein FQN54_000194 [Arachnomyces sp. PD_36]|nr:hypothetical protein FQN54_000194 [Arachnomyces sp. PD_36]
MSSVNTDARWITYMQAACALTGAFIFIYVVGGVLYRLYLSPLAKFPGPKLAGATLWYEFYYDNICKGQYTFKIKELHEKYGPIIRISPYELHVNDPDFYEVLYSQHSPRNKYYYFTKQFDLPLSAFGTEDHNVHRLRRGVMNPFFSKQRISRLEPVIQAQVQKLCERIIDFNKANAAVPISLGFSCLTTDIITEYVMTQSFHYLDAPDWLPQWPKTLQSTAETGIMAKQIPGIIPFLKSLPESWIEAMDPGMGLFFRFTKKCEEQIKDIMQNKEEMKRIAQDKMSTQPTLFHEILDSKLPPEEKTSARLGQELHGVVGAGTETTSGVLTFALYYLLRNPEKLERLKNEINELEPDKNVQLNLKDLEQLPYLTSVILEALRLNYGVSTRLQRISPNEALQFQDYTIPPGTPVGMTSVLMHHNESIFPDSYSFVPERWLDASERKRLEKYMVSFSKGSRQCVGMNLARAEMFITIATILRKFDFELHNTTDDDIVLKHDLFLPRPKNLDSNGAYVIVKN